MIKSVNEKTGKVSICYHGKSNGNKDDLVMALMMSLEVGRKFRYTQN